MAGLEALVQNNAAAIKRMKQIAPILCEWFDSELLELHRQMPQSSGGVLMGCPVWGDAYIRRMALYSLPTLGSDRNIAALSGKCWMVFYTQMKDRPVIWKVTRWLRQMGVHTIFRDLPDQLVALANTTSEDRYGLLATVQNLLGHMAGHAGKGLHMYMADHAYSEGFFERLMALGAEHKAIIQQSVSLNVEAAKADLEARRDPSGVIAIPAREMGGLALQHMHQRSSMFMMNDAPEGLWPDSRQLMWKGRDAIHIADSAQLLAWVSPELCLDAPIAFTSTLDMLAPEYIPPGAWHMPGPDDDMLFCELSDAGRIPAQSYVDLERFVFQAWNQVSFTEDYQEYFERRCLIPIPEQAGYLADDEIDRQHQCAIMAMRSGKAQAMDTYFRGQHPLRFDTPGAA